MTILFTYILLGNKQVTNNLDHNTGLRILSLTIFWVITWENLNVVN